MKDKAMAVLVLGSVMVGTTGVATAGMISGHVYSGVSIADGRYSTAQSTLRDLASNPGGFGNYVAMDAFSVDRINFSDMQPRSATPVTYGQFLSGPGNGLTGLDATLAATALTTSATTAAMFQFKGTAIFDQNFTINHDDGIILQLYQDGNLLYNYDYSYPVSPTVAGPFAGFTAGKYEFILSYQSWNGDPEVLQTTGMAPVPEPSSALLFFLGIAGFGMAARRTK